MKPNRFNGVVDATGRSQEMLNATLAIHAGFLAGLGLAATILLA
ncbi:hypothetical protein [Mesobaculum littorinae]|nr:hypothetical protein [Mesobaculum littorinae]